MKAMMNNPTTIHSDSFKLELDACLAKLNALVVDLDPYDRMLFMNEVILRLMPERKNLRSAQEKLSAKKVAVLRSLTIEQNQWISKLSDSTRQLSVLGGTNGIG